MFEGVAFIIPVDTLLLGPNGGKVVLGGIVVLGQKWVFQVNDKQFRLEMGILGQKLEFQRENSHFTSFYGLFGNFEHVLALFSQNQL